MIDYIQAIVLGAIQGLAEFLPVSSSGHLVLVPYVFGWEYQGLTLDIALHFGTVLALIAFFWRDWLHILDPRTWSQEPSVLPHLTSPTLGEAKVDVNNNLTIQQFNNYPRNFLWLIIIATIPAAVIGLLINDYVETYLHSPLLIAGNLIFFGWLLYFVDKRTRNLEPGALRPESRALSPKQALLIGLAQSIALVPGVSRSGITMTAARSTGLDRETAARFSFLIGTPAMIGAFILKLPDLNQGALGSSFWVAVAAAALFGLLAIKYLLNYLKKSDFAVFLWYRIILAIVVIGFYLLK